MAKIPAENINENCLAMSAGLEGRARNPVAHPPAVPPEVVQPWRGWLRDPTAPTRLQADPSAWPAAVVAATPFLVECCRRAGWWPPPPHLGLDPDDVWQEACLALWQAVARWDVKRGTRPITFLMPQVVWTLKNLWRNVHGGGIHVSRSQSEPLVYYWQALPVEQEDGAALTDGLDFLMDPEAVAAFDEVDLRIDLQGWWQQLSPRVQQCVRLRARGWTQDQIARQMGHSQMWVSRQFKEAADLWRTFRRRPMRNWDRHESHA